MPPNRTSSEQRFNIDLLEPETLAAPGGLQTALDSIQKFCYRDDPSITEVVPGLARSPHILEYVFSGTSCIFPITMGFMKQTAPVVLDDQAYEKLSKWIVSQFPTPATLNVMEASGIKLLQRLSSSLLSVEVVSTAEHRNELREFRRTAGLSLSVLKELAGCAGRASVDVSAPSVSRKKSKAPTRHIRLDPHPFDCMRIAVPVTEVEVRAVCVDILPQLQNILRVSVSPSLRPASRYSLGFSTTCLF
jgi:hypothetical protein